VCLGDESGMNCTRASLPIKRNQGRRLMRALRIRKDASQKYNFGRQVFHRKCTVHPQDFNTLDHAGLDVRPDGRGDHRVTKHVDTVRSPCRGCRAHVRVNLHERVTGGGRVRCRRPVHRAHGGADDDASVFRVSERRPVASLRKRAGPRERPRRVRCRPRPPLTIRSSSS
jgi:hypothetical protein